jgi:hypothetical protein
MKRAYHELSGREKREMADELMLPTSLFGVVLMAAVLLLLVHLRTRAERRAVQCQGNALSPRRRWLMV